MKAPIASSNLLDVYYWNPPAYATFKVWDRRRGAVQRLYDNRYGWFFRLCLDGVRVKKSDAKNWQEALDELESDYIAKYIAQ